MKRINNKSPYANLDLKTQVYMEARAMAEYCLANGKKIPPNAIDLLEKYNYLAPDNEKENPNKNAQTSGFTEPLVKAHMSLARAIEPAKPSTIFLLDVEQKVGGFLKFLGPVSLIRHLMLIAIVSLLTFILTGISGWVNQTQGEIMTSQGLPLFLNLIFYISAAGIGASFQALYRANAYIMKGTFDPTFNASYWIRLFLGLISGLILSIMISENALQSLAKDQNEAAVDLNRVLAPGIIRPTLAMLGGFSADLFYTLLSRLVETIESLFRGSMKSMADSKVTLAKAELASTQAQQETRVASNLMKLRTLIAETNDPGAVREKLEEMIEEIIPDTSFSEKGFSSGNSTAKG